MPNVTGKTKEKIAQSKRARAGALAIADKTQVALTCILRAFGFQISCRLYLVLLCLFIFCFVFVFFSFTEAAALRSSICMRPDSHTQLPNNCLRPFCFCFYFFLFLFLWGRRFSRIFLYHYRFLFVWRVCVFSVFSSHPFWTSSSLDVPAGVTQEEGHTGFLIHLPSAVRALIFVARRIQPFLSLVDREVEFCVLTN